MTTRSSIHTGSGHTQLGRALRALAAAAAAFVLVPAAAGAAVIAPDITTDEWATNPDGCSLREAVAAAEGGSEAPKAIGCTPGSSSGEDVIRLAPGTYELTIPVTSTDTLENGEGDLENFSPLAVEALPGGPVTIDANQHDRIFQTLGSGLRIDGITLTGGRVDNPAPGAGVVGGAIASSFTVPVVLTESAVVGNSADSLGGAISSQNLTLRNTTVSGNSTTESGSGGLHVSGTGSSLTLDHATITDNQTGGQPGGGGIGGTPTTSSVHNSIIAGNRITHANAQGPDCRGTLSSGGGNVIGSEAGCTFNEVPGDVVGADAMLAPLAANGGLTHTHALLPGSPADGLAAADCQAFDQRGAARPAAGCDAGAYEGPWARITSTNPLSPAADTQPEVLGTTQAGSTVSVHDDPGCNGPALAEGSAEEFAAGLTIDVPEQSTMQLHVIAVDALGKASACSAEAFPYVHRLPPPEPPLGQEPPAEQSGQAATAKRCRKGFKAKRVRVKGARPRTKCVRAKKRKRA